MRVIQCIAFDPVDGGVGGVDWRVQRDAGERLYYERIADPAYNGCEVALFELRVPDGMDNEAITRMADDAAWTRRYTPVLHREHLTT